MNQDFEQEDGRSAKLSTASLAHVDETTATDKDAGRAESPARSRDLDQPPADDEAGPVQPAISSGSTRFPAKEVPGQNQSRADASPIRLPASTVNATENEQPTATENEQPTQLFSEAESKDLFARWDALQVGFIDEPRRAVEQADNLVATAMKRTAEIFAEERARLEGQWDRGDNVSTEDLRIAIRRYRSFFRRLLAV